MITVKYKKTKFHSGRNGLIAPLYFRINNRRLPHFFYRDNICLLLSQSLTQLRLLLESSSTNERIIYLYSKRAYNILLTKKDNEKVLVSFRRKQRIISEEEFSILKLISHLMELGTTCHTYIKDYPIHDHGVLDLSITLKRCSKIRVLS